MRPGGLTKGGPEEKCGGLGLTRGDPANPYGTVGARRTGQTRGWFAIGQCEADCDCRTSLNTGEHTSRPSAGIFLPASFCSGTQKMDVASRPTVPMMSPAETPILKLLNDPLTRIGVARLRNCAVLACGLMRKSKFSSVKFALPLPVTRILLVSSRMVRSTSLPSFKSKRPIAQFTFDALPGSTAGTSATSTFPPHRSNAPACIFWGHTANSMRPDP